MKVILIFLTTCFLLTGCSKDKTDYRSDFLGEYNLEYHYTFIVLGNPPYVSTDTTISYTGQIKAFETDQISVDLPNGDVLKFEVDQSGSLSYCLRRNAGSIGNNSFHIFFDDDACIPGPLGANYLVEISGSK